MLNVPWGISDTDEQNSLSFVHFSYFPQMPLMVGLPESSGGWIRSYPLPVSSPPGSPWSRITRGMNSRPVGGRNSETYTHPIIINQSINQSTYTFNISNKILWNNFMTLQTRMRNVVLWLPVMEQIFFVFILYGKLDWVTQENSTYLGNQNPSRNPKTINLLLKSHVSQLRKHCTGVLSVFVCAKWLSFLFYAKVSAVMSKSQIVDFSY
jgi:hypothetical protein